MRFVEITNSTPVPRSVNENRKCDRRPQLSLIVLSCIMFSLQIRFSL